MRRTGIFLCLLLAFLFFNFHPSDADDNFDNFDTLGDRISARVHQQVAHLDGLGDRISAQVQRNLDQAFGGVGAQPGVENNGPYQDDWKTYTMSNMGPRISQQVEQEMAPLQNLGDRIRAQVQKSLEPVRTLHGKMKNGVTGVTNAGLLPSDLSNMGSRISQQVERETAPLHNLGDRINAQVQKSLEPVRALEMHMKMKNGVGGVTVAEHFPSGRIFFIRNYKMFACNDKVDWDKATCLGIEERFVIQKQEDWCFAHPGNYVRINDQICLSTGTTSVSVINNVIHCRANDKEGLVLFTNVTDFHNMCQGKSESVNYKYFADAGSPIAVKIPNENPYVTCKNREENVCEFTENHNFA